ncbi:MAG: hypothetical protein AB7T49_05190 [Oligoflexales bacterium]
MRLFQIICCLLTSWSLSWISTAAFAKKNRLTAPKTNPSRKEIISYKQCKEKSLAIDPGDVTSNKTKLALAQCRDQFPASYLFLECKAKVLSRFKSDKSKFDQALKKCREELQLRSFNAAKPIPFYNREEQAFFAGIGLNVPQKFSTLDQWKEEGTGNFSCEPLSEALRDPAKTEFLMFGNDPLVFVPKKPEARFKKFKAFLKSTKPEDLKVQYGEIVRENKEDTVFFPSSFCYFTRKLGDIYSGIKVYYLLDRQKGLATPYFGVAFYKEGFDNNPTAFAEKVVESLGPEYKILETRPETIFIGREAIESKDSEGDPRNLCKDPGRHGYIAVLKIDTKTKKANYISVVNVHNLCRFGQRVSLRQPPPTEPTEN